MKTLNEHTKIEAWMFRESHEYLFLLVSIVLTIIIGFIAAEISIYIVLVGIVLGFIYIKLQQAQLIGNAIQVNDDQFPEIYNVFEDYKNRLGLLNVDLYIIQDPNPNAFTIGFPTASIILHSTLVENLNTEELKFVIAHELGHVKASHNIILTFIYPLGNGVPGASLIFGLWRRRAEYTSDKCGLILTKKLESAIMSLLKITVGLKLAESVDLESYRKQLIDSDKGIVKASEYLFDHPLSTNRINKMVKFWKFNFIHQ